MGGRNKRNERGIEDKSSNLVRLLQLTQAESKKIIISAFFMIVSGVTTAGYAYLVGPMVRVLYSGSEIRHAQTATLSILEKITFFFSGAKPTWIAAAIFVAAALKGVSFYAHTLITAKSGQNILHRLRCELFDGVLRHNPLDPRIGESGDLVVRFTADVAEVETAVSKGVIAYIRHVIELLALAGLALALDYRLGLIGLVAFPPAGVAIARLGKTLRRRRRAVHTAIGSVGYAVSETAAGLSAIQAFDAGRTFSDRFNKLSLGIRRTSLVAFAVRAVSSPINELLGAAGLAATLVFAADAIADGSLLPETFISFFAALFMLYQPVKGIGTAHHAVESGLAALDRISPLLSSEKAAENSARSPVAFREELMISDISCGYGDGPTILKKLSLTVSKGDRISLVGPSGSGKTTLFNLLLGFLPTRSGEIRIDGKRVASATYRRLFAPVRQEPFLFDDTIFENVRMGRPDADNEAVSAACRSAGVSAFAEMLPEGLQTCVGPSGTGLSIGQRQRVALARALLSDAPVLLLDEVTASLDGRTEKSIVSELDTAFSNKTILIVTHRRATAEWTERLVLLEDGNIAVDGPADEMLEKHQRVVALFGAQVERTTRDPSR